MLNATQAGAGRGWLAAVACLPSRLRTCCRQHALPCGCSPPSTAPLQAQRYTATTTFYSHTHVLALLLPTCPTGLLLPRYPAAACGVGQCHHHPPPRPPQLPHPRLPKRHPAVGRPAIPAGCRATGRGGGSGGSGSGRRRSGNGGNRGLGAAGGGDLRADQGRAGPDVWVSQGYGGWPGCPLLLAQEGGCKQSMTARRLRQREAGGAARQLLLLTNDFLRDLPLSCRLVVVYCCEGEEELSPFIPEEWPPALASAPTGEPAAEPLALPPPGSRTPPPPSPSSPAPAPGEAGPATVTTIFLKTKNGAGPMGLSWAGS